MSMKGRYLFFLLGYFLISLLAAPSAQASGSCSGYCRTCGQYDDPCGAWVCQDGGKISSDTITSLPSGPIRNSGEADADGCPDNYPSSQNSVPFSHEGTTYKSVPFNVLYTKNICVCT